MRETLRTRLVAYGVAVLATGISLFLRWSLLPVTGYHTPFIFMTFFPAIILSAYVGGLGPGLVSTGLSAAAAKYFLIKPFYSLQVQDEAEAVALGLFVLTGVVISGLTELLHRSRHRIAASERRYALTLASIGDAVIATDIQTRVTFLNPAAETLTGWTLADAVGQPLAEVFRIVNEQSRQSVQDFAAKVLRSGTVTGLANHTVLLARDGREVSIDHCGAPIIDDRNAVAGVVLVFRDVSQRRQAQEVEAFRASEQRWRSLTEALPQLVWSATPDGACDYFSSQWTEHTGVAEAELLGWRWLQTLHPEDRERTRQFWLESVAGRHPYDVEYRVRRRGGEYLWFKTRGVPIRNSNGTVVKWFGTCTDITDLRQTEAELRQAKDAAETANRAKDEFLANVSHEIRTPMNAILGMTELALDTNLSEEQRQWLHTVKSAGDNLLIIINDLLDFAKIEAGKMELDAADFSLRGVVGDTLKALAVRAHKKGLELIYNVQPDVSDALVGDAGRLRQVLLNLVGNAIKFTDKGEVVINVGLQSSVSDPHSTVCHLRFSVKDTGIGIVPHQQKRIFRAFEQEDTSTTRKYGGTGLGLTIASQLVSLMGGQITVDSQPGHGSTFTFTACFMRSHQAPTIATRSSRFTNHLPTGAPLNILVAEDNEFNSQLLEQLFARRGHRVTLAGNGREALHLALQRKFDLLVLDVHMPELNGFRVAESLREQEQTTSGHLPIIALTAHSRKEDRERCLAAGMDDFLAKPIHAADLWAAIDRVMGSRPQAEQPSLLDTRALLAACGGDAVILERICQVLRTRLPDHLKAVQEALRDRDAPRLSEVAHKLAGMVAAFSSVAGGVASALEDLASQDKLEEAPPLVAQLEGMTEELTQLAAGLSLDALRNSAERWQRGTTTGRASSEP